MNRYVVEFKTGYVCVVYAADFFVLESSCGFKYLTFKNEEDLVAEFIYTDIYCVKVSRRSSGIWSAPEVVLKR